MEKSVLQRQAELSKFDDGAVRCRREASRAAADLVQASTLPVVPASCDYIYAPSAPAADWAGLVVTQKRRAQVRGRASQASLTQSEAGIVGSSAEGQFSGRRRFENRRAALLWTAESTARTTAAHDAMQGQKGGLDSHKRRGKKLLGPAYAVEHNPASCQKESRQDPRLVGYRAKEVSATGPSMLSRVAHSIMSGFEPPPPVYGARRPHHGVMLLDTSGNATSGNVATATSGNATSRNVATATSGNATSGNVATATSGNVATGTSRNVATATSRKVPPSWHTP